MTAAKTHIIGLGAQKAGTSWLYRYLTAAPEVVALDKKEFHIWDALCVPEFRHFQIAPEVLALDPAERKALVAAMPGPARFSRKAMQIDPEMYFEYFASLLERPGTSASVDITPSYAGLPTSAWERIDAGFAARGVTCRYIFVLRDPLERCASAARMNLSRRIKSGQDFTQDDLAKVLEEIYDNQEHLIRAAYDHTIAALEAAIPSERIFLALYEELHSEPELRRLSDFLGIAPRPELAQERVFAFPNDTEISPDLKRRIVQRFARVYTYCAERFPQSRALWPGWDYL